MTTYKYEVIDANGKRKKGSIESADYDTALKELKSAGNMVVNLGAAGLLEKDINITIGAAVKARELSVFCRQFQSILNAGVTVVEALDMLANQTDNKIFQQTLVEVRDSVQKGDTLAGAMSRYPKVFPDLMVHMVSAGEASGSLDVAFDRVGKQFEKDAHMSGMLMKSMIYPAVLIVVIIIVVIIMMTTIVPNFTSTFDQIDAELPGITLAVMAVSDALVNSWYYILGGVILAVILLREFKKTEAGGVLFGQLGLKLPLFGNLTIKSASANLTRTLSTLMAAGISLVDAIVIVKRIVKNVLVQRALEKAETDVSEGRLLSHSLEDSGIFPSMVYQMIRIGEETGNMETMLDKISDYFEEEVQMATESLMAAMEPLIIIVMAVVVVPIILAIMMPMFSIYNAI